MYNMFDARSQPQVRAAVVNRFVPFSTISQGPFSAKNPNMELSPGPPLSQIVRTELG
jgi:hypothetical protein